MEVQVISFESMFYTRNIKIVIKVYCFHFRHTAALGQWGKGMWLPTELSEHLCFMDCSII